MTPSAQARNFCLLLAGCSLAWMAMAAPGEDPVTVNGKVSYLQLPTARPGGSADIVHRRGLPDHAKAKIARYVARAYAPDLMGVQTEKDVVSAVHTNGTRTTCVQTLAPRDPGNSFGSDQVVVIRGDLVNVCN